MNKFKRDDGRTEKMPTLLFLCICASIIYCKHYKWYLTQDMILRGAYNSFQQKKIIMLHIWGGPTYIVCLQRDIMVALWIPKKQVLSERRRRKRWEGEEGKHFYVQHAVLSVCYIVCIHFFIILWMKIFLRHTYTVYMCTNTSTGLGFKFASIHALEMYPFSQKYAEHTRIYVRELFPNEFQIIIVHRMSTA